MADSSNSTAAAAADARSGQSAGQFAASLVTSIVIFAVQFLAFLLIKDRLARIYQPRTFLVPERERTEPVKPGWWKWIKPVLATSNSEFVQKCGLDAYFFLRYLRTLLKIFVPAALVILPILLPINAIGGRGGEYALTHEGAANVSGLDQLAWGNIRPDHNHRYWAHWFLALLLVCYVCYIAFDELRNYIRMRQAYMTSPQHRLRASATTVLVSSIPEKWLSVEALDGLYDVFPGGLRNIWINRNYDELSQKVQRRDELAAKLESAETALIRKCYKAHEKELMKAAKEAGTTVSKEDKQHQDAVKDEKGREKAQSGGLDSGNPHQVKHTLRQALGEENDTAVEPSEQAQEGDRPKERRILPIPILGEGIQDVASGIERFGKGIAGGFRGVNKTLNGKIDTTNGFIIEPETNDQHHEHVRRFMHEHDPHLRHRQTNESEQVNATSDALSPEDGTISAYSHTRNSSANETSQTSPTGLDESMDKPRPSTQADNDRQPLKDPVSSANNDDTSKEAPGPAKPLTRMQKLKEKLGFSIAAKPTAHVKYAQAFDEQFDKDSDEAVWMRYLKEKDRDTMRLPIFGWDWMISLPFIGRKVDTIYYCRKEVARLNVEIEDDQAHPERFPLMNSAFIQFNHQVAAHMACQTVSHHIPKHMGPRLVEIDPTDVIWDNMSIPWWQRYIRTAAVISIVTAMIVLWAIPVAFTSALSQLSVAAATYTWLRWVLEIPSVIRSILQGVLSPALLALLMFLLPVVLRLLATIQGLPSGMLVELSVQNYYFFFLFVQIFLVVTVANGFLTFFSYFKSADGITNIPNLLGTNIPKASNYFFSYMILQALSVSAGALLQVGGLISWYILAFLFDSTARAKFLRQTQLSNIQWGTFFPVYTNLACIGLIYSVISPLILIFNIITFALFWFVYRYQTLYITRFTLDTGGLLYPNAINLTFVGVYTMEIALIGMFFLVRNADGSVACTGQGIGMVVILVLTAGYQILLNNAFSPLFRYLPITLEDDAVKRDEAFARAMQTKHGYKGAPEDEDEDIEDQLESDERDSLDKDRQLHEYEMQRIAADREGRSYQPEAEELDLQNPEVTLDLDKESKGYRFMRKTAQKTADITFNKIPENLPLPARESRKSWADRGNARNNRSSHFGAQRSPVLDSDDQATSHADDQPSDPHTTRRRKLRNGSPPRELLNKINNFNPLMGDEKDVEAQQAARTQLANALFSGVNDELEDLTADQRDALFQRAFQHSAVRARRPVIWIPRDDLGVSDDELLRMGKFSKNLWVSNVRQGLDAKGRCVYSGAPPDFSEVDVIRL